jgi:hypothetical protein
VKGPLYASIDGSSLHAGAWVSARDREKLEKLCRYAARPAVAEPTAFGSSGDCRFRELAAVEACLTDPDRAVFAACVNHARGWAGIESAPPSISAEGTATRALYESLGCVTWRTEPDSLRIDGAEVAEHHMALKLPPSGE